MREHEEMREMCAAASIGQLSPEQLAELERHLAGCADCRGAYAEYSDIAGLEYSLREHDTSLSPAEANRYLNSPLLRSRFLARAADEGIIFSDLVDRARAQSKLKSFPLLHSSSFRTPAAIAAAVLLVVSASLIWHRAAGRGVASPATAVKSAAQQLAATSEATADADHQRLKDSLARESKLESQVSVLKTELEGAIERAARAETALQEHAGNERELLAKHDSQYQSLQDLRQKLDHAEAALVGARQSAADAEVKADSLEASFVADQVQIHELSDQLAERSAELDRERRMLQAGREVRDLMAARNLHIVDVFDTDPKGKTKPTFGRIFFTEGKSLVFYAYDLNDAKIEKGGQYRVWGTKEGQEKQARNLGIFYSDDASQRRWVFKYSDPKVLDEIDSVFVTFEQPGESSIRPKGQKLMDAYLRAQPNHP